jgi:hypothetical protein
MFGTVNKPKVGKPQSGTMMSLSRGLPKLRLPRSLPPGIAGKPHPSVVTPRSTRKK